MALMGHFRGFYHKIKYVNRRSYKENVKYGDVGEGHGTAVS